MIISKDICDKLTDAEIVEKSLLDVDYFSCLYQKYEKKLTRYIKRISHLSEGEAEDILQESFIKIWSNLNDYDSSLSLSSWLYRIVHNQTISFWRKKKSYGKDNVMSLSDSLLELEDQNQKNPIESNDKNERIKTSLNTLSNKYREIIILKYFENLSYIEISDVLKIPEGTVAIRLNRAKKQLLKKYNSMTQK